MKSPIDLATSGMVAAKLKTEKEYIADNIIYRLKLLEERVKYLENEIWELRLKGNENPQDDFEVEVGNISTKIDNCHIEIEKLRASLQEVIGNYINFKEEAMAAMETAIGTMKRGIAAFIPNEKSISDSFDKAIEILEEKIDKFNKKSPLLYKISFLTCMRYEGEYIDYLKSLNNVRINFSADNVQKQAKNHKELSELLDGYYKRSSRHKYSYDLNTNSFDRFIAQSSNLANYAEYRNAINKAELAFNELQVLKANSVSKNIKISKHARFVLRSGIREKEIEYTRLSQKAEVEAKKIDKAISQAQQYADQGTKILEILLKATSKDQFKEEMEALKDEINQKLFPDIPNNPSAFSNLVSCLDYALRRDSFNLNQGYGKGALILQFGTGPEDRQRNEWFWSYFIPQQEKKNSDKSWIGWIKRILPSFLTESSAFYPRISTHGFSEAHYKKFHEGSESKKDSSKSTHVGIDISKDPSVGHVPLALKDTRHLLMVSGREFPNQSFSSNSNNEAVNENEGIQKTLLKCESWGTRLPHHSIFHSASYIDTREWYQNAIQILIKIYNIIMPEPIKPEVILENRTDTKYVFEMPVEKVVSNLKTNEELLNSMKNHNNTGSGAIINDRFLEIFSHVEIIRQQKGFDAPIKSLIAIYDDLEKLVQVILESNVNTFSKAVESIRAFQLQVIAQIEILEAAKAQKYSSDYQLKSEGRRVYSLDGKTGKVVASLEKIPPVDEPLDKKDPSHHSGGGSNSFSL